MTRRQLVSWSGIMTAWVSLGFLRSAEALGFSEPKLDPLIADLVGEWRITYNDGASREYKVDSKGVLSFEAEQSQGQIVRKSEALLIWFPGNPKMERLTMGVDGRLFVEHFPSQDELVKNKPALIGIGIRQK